MEVIPKYALRGKGRGYLRLQSLSVLLLFTRMVMISKTTLCELQRPESAYQNSVMTCTAQLATNYLKSSLFSSPVELYNL